MLGAVAELLQTAIDEIVKGITGEPAVLEGLPGGNAGQKLKRLGDVLHRVDAELARVHGFADARGKH